VSLLLVPHYHGLGRADHDPAFAVQVHRRLNKGDEVLLHGYAHQDTGMAAVTPTDWLKRHFLTAREGEFAALTHQQAHLIIQRGLACLRRMDITTHGFVAPAWLLSTAAFAALQRSGLYYTCDRDELIRIRDGFKVAAPSLVWSTRAHWRRGASLLWNRTRLARLRHNPCLRIALHPNDVRFPAIWQQCQEIIKALVKERLPILESHYLQGMTEEATQSAPVPIPITDSQ